MTSDVNRYCPSLFRNASNGNRFNMPSGTTMYRLPWMLRESVAQEMHAVASPLQRRFFSRGFHQHTAGRVFRFPCDQPVALAS